MTREGVREVIREGVREGVREIGSHFSLVLDENKYDNLSSYEFYATGRSCLKGISKQLPLTKPILCPNYLCPSMVDNIIDQPIVYYEIDETLSINIDSIIQLLKVHEPSTILIIDYFGIVDENIDEVIAIATHNELLIIQDITQSYLCLPKSYGHILFGSIRKTLPVIDGAIFRSYCDIEIEPNVNKSYWHYVIMRLLAMFLKRYPSLKKWWRPLMLYSDKLLEEDEKIRPMSSVSHTILNRSNLDAIYNSRVANYLIINNYLRHLALYPERILWFGFPIVLQNQDERDYLRKKLISNRIYPAIHWSINHPLAKKILTLPIDQRYGEEEMNRMGQLVIDLLEETHML